MIFRGLVMAIILDTNRAFDVVLTKDYWSYDIGNLRSGNLVVWVDSFMFEPILAASDATEENISGPRLFLSCIRDVFDVIRNGIPFPFAGDLMLVLIFCPEDWISSLLSSYRRLFPWKTARWGQSTPEKTSWDRNTLLFHGNSKSVTESSLLTFKLVT